MAYFVLTALALAAGGVIGFYSGRFDVLHNLLNGKTVTFAGETYAVREVRRNQESAGTVPEDLDGVKIGVGEVIHKNTPGGDPPFYPGDTVKANGVEYIVRDVRWNTGIGLWEISTLSRHWLCADLFDLVCREIPGEAENNG